MSLRHSFINKLFELKITANALVGLSSLSLGSTIAKVKCKYNFFFEGKTL